MIDRLAHGKADRQGAVELDQPGPADRLILVVTAPGIVVLVLPRIATARFVLDLVEAFLRDAALVRRLPGRLAIVEAGRARLRPR